MLSKDYVARFQGRRQEHRAVALPGRSNAAKVRKGRSRSGRPEPGQSPCRPSRCTTDGAPAGAPYAEHESLRPRMLGTVAGDESITMHSGDIHALGLFAEQPNSFSVASLQTTSYAGKAGSGQYVQVAATAFMLLHGKPQGSWSTDDFRTLRQHRASQARPSPTFEASRRSTTERSALAVSPPPPASASPSAFAAHLADRPHAVHAAHGDEEIDGAEHRPPAVAGRLHPFDARPSHFVEFQGGR